MYHGLAFFIFTKVKLKIKERRSDLAGKHWVDFCVGMLAPLGQIVSYPLDAIKRRVQGQGMLLQSGEITQRLTVSQMARVMWAEGLTSFYKGCTLNLIKSPLSSGTSWMIKNAVNRSLDKDYNL